MKKILIDTDPGIDDAMAIQMAFAHPDLDVVGLTTVFGNVHVEVATRNALRLVELARADCPVAEGADRPLVQPLRPPAYFVHGGEGFGNLPKSHPKGQPDMRTAARFIVNAINENPGEIHLCPVGPLTNIALALRIDPSIVERVAHVTIMGGAVRKKGNVTDFAEANIWNDPHAAAEVLAADWPMTLIGLDVTEQTTCTPADVADLAARSPEIGGFLNEAVQFYFDWHKTKEAKPDGCYLHDPSAVLAVADPTLFDGPEAPISVVCGGEQIGRTVMDRGASTRPVRACTEVDSAEVKRRFLEITATADQVRARRT